MTSNWSLTHRGRYRSCDIDEIVVAPCYTREMSRKCPDCKGGMGAIQVLDRVGDRGDRHETGLAYTALDESASFWTQGFPIHGTIEALVCKKCRRVLFYAVPME